MVGEKFLVMLLRRIVSRGFPTNLARGLSTSAATITGREVISASIGLNEDQRNFYELAKSFSENEMKPFAAKWDEDSHFPVDTFKKFGELGFAGIFVNEDFGGSGLSRVDTVVIVEALASGCVGTTAMLTIHNMCAGECAVMAPECSCSDIFIEDTHSFLLSFLFTLFIIQG